MSEQQFQLGDLVEAFGTKGKVISVDAGWNHYPINVEFVNGYTVSFTSDGRERAWHGATSLKLISRPQKMEKKKVWVFGFTRKEKPPQNVLAACQLPKDLAFVQVEAEVPCE